LLDKIGREKIAQVIASGDAMNASEMLPGSPAGLGPHVDCHPHRTANPALLSSAAARRRRLRRAHFGVPDFNHVIVVRIPRGEGCLKMGENKMPALTTSRTTC